MEKKKHSVCVCVYTYMYIHIHIRVHTRTPKHTHTIHALDIHIHTLPPNPAASFIPARNALPGSHSSAAQIWAGVLAFGMTLGL